MIAEREAQFVYAWENSKSFNNLRNASSTYFTVSICMEFLVDNCSSHSQESSLAHIWKRDILNARTSAGSENVFTHAKIPTLATASRIRLADSTLLGLFVQSIGDPNPAICSRLCCTSTTEINQPTWHHVFCQRCAVWCMTPAPVQSSDWMLTITAQSLPLCA